MSGLLKQIETRRARRALDERALDDEIISRLLTAATYAPSCFNNQPWRLMAVTKKEGLEKLHGALTGGNYWAKKAPLIVVLATKLSFDAQHSDNRDYAMFGCGLATGNLLLQAEKEGLYGHPMAGFDPFVVKKEFKIEEDYIIANLIAVGYPGPLDGLNEKHVLAEQSDRERKPEAEVICHESWSL